MSSAYYKRFPRSFLDACIGLEWTLERKGAYAVLIDLIFMRDGNLPDDPQYIAGQLGCSVRKWNSIKSFLISQGKISDENGIISNKTADNLIIERRKLRDKNAENATKTNEIKAEKKRQRQPDATPRVEEYIDITPDVSSSNEESTSGTSLPLEISDREFIWSSGIDLLTRNGIQERSARSFLGMQIKTAGGSAAGEKIVATAITAAMQAGSGDPQAYIVQTVKSEKRKPVIREEETEEPTALRKSADGKFLEKIRQSDGVVILRQPLEVAA